MPRDVVWQFPAIEALMILVRTDRAQAFRIIRAIQQYAVTGRADIKKLAGSSGEWRLRVGDWRVMFIPVNRTNSIHVIAVRLRRDAYDD